MANEVVDQEVRRSLEAFRVVQNPAWIEQGAWIQEVSVFALVLNLNSPIRVVLINVVLLIERLKPRLEHSEIELVFVASSHQMPYLF